jgi:hypothetical protein
MITKNQDYSLLHGFFEHFSKAGIAGINPSDPLMVELDEFMEMNNQLFYISDVILMDILFLSKSVTTIFGIEPEKVTPGFFITTTHPEDFNRHHLARTKLVSMADELYMQKKGQRIISMNVRARKPDGSYFNALYQANLFYSKVPYESVFLILVLTDISLAEYIHKGFHFYCGDDSRMFRFPDDALLLEGSIFTPTEFEIIKFIDQGLSTNDIAEKVFRSPFTINTHRTNIIKKSGKLNMPEVIRNLKDKGLL